jgi:hypothetical protein
VELPDVIANHDGWISVDRDPTEVFNEDSIASFTGKPITNDHPTTVVTPDNWHSLAIGTVQNVRKGAGDDHDCLVADLLFTAQRGIDLIRSGKRALSVGYDAVYEQTQPGRAKQRQIVANHVALVDEGRCGPRCTIVDHAPWYNVDYADPPSLPRRGPPVRQYLGAAPPAMVVFGVRRQVGDFADIDYPWTRDLEAWVNEPRDPEGQWTTGGGSHAPQENAREPVIGKPITVMRVGSEKGGLGGRDAGNLASVANHYVRLSDFETPSSRGGSPTHMSVYQITLPPQLGEYQRFNAHSGGGTGDLVGRAAGKRGDGFHIVYSFPKTYKDEKRTLSIPLAEVDAELKKMGYNNADEAGGNETAKAMQAVIDRHTAKEVPTPRVPEATTTEEESYFKAKKLADTITKAHDNKLLAALKHIRNDEIREAMDTLQGRREHSEDDRSYQALSRELVRRTVLEEGAAKARVHEYAFMDDKEFSKATGLDFGGTSGMRLMPKAELGKLPTTHIQALARHGTKIRIVKDIAPMPDSHPYAPGMQPAGLFNPDTMTIQVADQITLPDGSVRLLDDREQTLRHEVGHAIDKISGMISPQFDLAVERGIEGMLKHEEMAARYWLGGYATTIENQRRAKRLETFAEIYAFAYNPDYEPDKPAGFGGLSGERMRQLFGPAAKIMKEYLSNVLGEPEPAFVKADKKRAKVAA